MANAPTQHAKLSPSGAHRWMECPASVVMEVGCYAPGSKYADEGTAAHELAAWTLQDGAHRCDAYLGRLASNGWEIDEDMCNDVQTYVDNVLAFADGHLLLVEQPLPLGHLTGEAGAEGTGDAVVITSCGEEVQVHDLKYGRGNPVRADGNKQLKLYALGAVQKYAFLGDFKRARLIIHQPRITSAPSEWDIDAADLKAFGAEVESAATLAWQALALGPDKLPEDAFNPGTEQCRWCKAKGMCPALGRKVQSVVLGDFEELGPEEVATATQNLTKLTNQELAARMEAADLVEGWLKAVRATVEAKLLHGENVPGYKLVQGKQGNRAWSDKDGAEAALKSMRLTIPEMYTLKLISPTQAEKLLKKENPRRWAKLQPLVSRSEGSPSVAAESDPRPALALTPVVDDFDVQTGTEEGEVTLA